MGNSPKRPDPPAFLVFLAAAIERYSKWGEQSWIRLLLAVGAILLIVPKLWTAVVGASLVGLAISVTRLLARVAF